MNVAYCFLKVIVTLFSAVLKSVSEKEKPLQLKFSTGSADPSMVKLLALKLQVPVSSPFGVQAVPASV